MRPREAGACREREAEAYLVAHGLSTVARNFTCRLGEIDLIMMDDECLVFVEVRYRGNPGHGSGAESVTWAKRQHLIRAARVYRQRDRERARYACRFDVVSMRQAAGRLQFDWIRNAFTA